MEQKDSQTMIASYNELQERESALIRELDRLSALETDENKA